MKNKILKKVIVIMSFLYLIISLFSNVKALTWDEMEEQAKNFQNHGKNQTNINYTNVTAEFKDLAQILTMIGSGVMIAVTMYMGIKYLTSGPEAQAKLKGQLVGLLVSGLVVFASYPIWKIVLEIVSKF